jgi:CHAD domain-containing protein
MGRNSKWIECQPTDTVDRVCQRAVATRLGRLWHYLERAVHDPTSEVESVHQLRVFTRRSAAAIELFEDWLPKRRVRWLRKQLKRIRKSAGPARDLDVLRIRWTAELAQLPPGQAALLLEQVKRRRRRAQWPIEDAYQNLASKRFPRRARKLTRRIGYRGNPALRHDTIESLAHSELRRLLNPYFAAAAADLHDIEGLHAFRIESKHVRYAMEIFAGVFDDGFRGQLYPLVADLQDRLGRINDHATAQQNLLAWCNETEAPAVRQALEAGIRLEQRALETSRIEFLTWWNCERRDDLRRQFSRYVSFDTPSEAI